VLSLRKNNAINKPRSAVYLFDFLRVFYNSKKSEIIASGTLAQYLPVAFYGKSPDCSRIPI